MPCGAGRRCAAGGAADAAPGTACAAAAELCRRAARRRRHRLHPARRGRRPCQLHGRSGQRTRQRLDIEFAPVAAGAGGARMSTAKRAEMKPLWLKAKPQRDRLGARLTRAAMGAAALALLVAALIFNIYHYASRRAEMANASLVQARITADGLSAA